MPFPEVCHERLVLFFTDFALSIVRALVSATPRGDLGRWVNYVKLWCLSLCHSCVPGYVYSCRCLLIIAYYNGKATVIDLTHQLGYPEPFAYPVPHVV